jgi:hypothetical protein
VSGSPGEALDRGVARFKLRQAGGQLRVLALEQGAGLLLRVRCEFDVLAPEAEDAVRPGACDEGPMGQEVPAFGDCEPHVDIALTALVGGDPIEDLAHARAIARMHDLRPIPPAELLRQPSEERLPSTLEEQQAPLVVKGPSKLP